MTSTVAEHLRTLDDDELADLLQRRPDVAVPLPADLSQLAARLQSRVSVARALDGLDQFTLEVLDTLRLVRSQHSTVAVEQVLTLTAEAGVDSAQVRSALARLRALMLIHGPDSALRLVGAIDELTPTYPMGLGRPAATLADLASKGRHATPDVVALVNDPAGLRRAVLAAPPEARAVLDRLAEGPPIGQAALRPRPGEAGESPVTWLIQHGLLVPIGDDLVELPREVGILLRRETGPLGVLHPAAPQAPTQARPGADSAGAGQAMEVVRHLDALLAVIAETPPPVLRSYGLGVRDLRRLARETGLTEPTTALLLEIARAAGLLDSTELGGESRFLPTQAYDGWRAGSIAAAWALLARAWLGMTRAPVLVGERDERDKPINALSVEVTRAGAPAARRAVLGVLAQLPPATALDADAVLAQLAWHAPRRYLRTGRSGTGTGGMAAAETLARSILREAAELGVTGLSALTSFGRMLLDDRPDPDDDPLGIRAQPDPLVAALDALLPAPVDHLLVQADLTVIIPGPPEPTLAADLAALADTESRGGATVYRVTAGSIRRALDMGFSAADIHAVFSRRSRTPLPQTLTYLVDDVARRHGGLRVGTAGAYLRGDDETLLAEVLADRRLAGLALRRLAPTVLATVHTPSRTLEVLREAGYAPVAEDATGAVVLSRPAVARAPGRGLAPWSYQPADDIERQRLHGPRLAAAVEQLRRGDRIARAARRSPLAKPAVAEDGTPVTASQAHAQALAVLRQGIAEKKRVWVGFVDAHGSTGSRLVRPVSMGGGFLHAEDDRSQTRHTFALHRITAAALDA